MKTKSRLLTGVMIAVICGLSSIHPIWGVDDSIKARARVAATDLLLVEYEQGQEWGANAECQRMGSATSPCNNYELWNLPGDWNADPRNRPTLLSARFESGSRTDGNLTLQIKIQLEADHDYLLVIKDAAVSTSAAKDLGIAFFSTKAQAKVEKTAASSMARRQVFVRSDVAFQPPSGQLKLEEIRQKEIKDKNGKIIVPEKKRDHPGAIFALPTNPQDIASVGQIDVRLDRSGISKWIHSYAHGDNCIPLC